MCYNKSKHTFRQMDEPFVAESFTGNHKKVAFKWYVRSELVIKT